MRKLTTPIIGWLTLILLFTGCEIITYEEHATPSYNGDFAWTQLTKKAEWGNRLDHSSVFFKDKLWVLGGYNPGITSGDTYLEDVWNSNDGKTWNLVTDKAPWLGRRGHTTIVFDDGSGEAMFVIGGFVVNEENGYREYRNDVWKSTDGENWTQIKERTVPPLDSLFDWYPRFNHSTVKAIHEGIEYVYLIGGYTMLEDWSARYSPKYFNDVWRSTDCIHWESLPNQDFGIRAEHACTVDPNSGKIYIQGGHHGVIIQDELNASHPNPEFFWLWSSEDGIHWTPENDTANFEQNYLSRAEHQLVIINENLYALPGCTTSNEAFHFSQWNHYAYWKYDMENIWSVDSEGSDFGGRYAYSIIEHNDKIWVLGGDTDTNGPNNDVWIGELK